MGLFIPLFIIILKSNFKPAMKKISLFTLVLLFAKYSYTQIEVVRIVGKNSSEYNIGFGAALKFGYPVSEAAYATLEGGIVFAPLKYSDFTQGIALIPVKLGYRYTLDGSGTGFYVEPQVGYNVHGALSNDIVDKNISGFEWAACTGYLFQPGGKIQFDIGLRYETTYYNGGSASFVGLRLSHNFSFGRRNDY